MQGASRGGGLANVGWTSALARSEVRKKHEEETWTEIVASDVKHVAHAESSGGSTMRERFPPRLRHRLLVPPFRVLEGWNAEVLNVATTDHAEETRSTILASEKSHVARAETSGDVL